ncbi:hypothetical protein ACH5RR_013887 [Cinchona calisaya]|uniref:BHLH domain-containing protein n=1 Tax=Cinchona calisaya TaxID=153742 RepID=A0ABD3A1A6_9GENT
MELVKDHAPKNSTFCLIQPHPYYENDRFEEGSSSEKSARIAKNFAVTRPSSLSSPSNTNSDGLGHQKALKYPPEDGHSVSNNFKGVYGNFANAGESFLSFDRSDQNSFPRIISSTNQDDYSVWGDNLHYTNYQNQLNNLENSNNIQSSSSYASTSNGVPIPFGYLSQEANTNASIHNGNSIQDLGTEEACSSAKRPHTEESIQALKKQCTSVTKTTKSKSITSTKDPQSVAAKNRRERISERLKVLQDLVPNGSKVLASDEFWPAQGANAPDLSLVKEAIDAILASQRDRNPSSSSK